MSSDIRTGAVLAGFRVKALIGRGATGDRLSGGGSGKNGEVALKLLRRS